MIRLRRAARAAQESVLNVVAVLGVVAILAATLSLALDLRVLAFESGSMSPTISTGSLAVARSVPAADLDRGDVVSVLTVSGSRVTHRIVEIEKADGRAVLRLQGDGNQVADAASYPVAEADRVLFSVPLLGYAGSALSSPVGQVGLGFLVALLVAVLIRESARPRHRGARSRAVLVAALAIGVAGPSALVGRVDSTLAAWTDPVTANAGAFSAATVPAPTQFSCGKVAAFELQLTWADVPGATSYTVHYGAGKTQTLVGGVWRHNQAGGPFLVWVVANRAFGSTTWSSVASATRTYTVGSTTTCK